jgi:hypothetical protein
VWLGEFSDLHKGVRWRGRERERERINGRVVAMSLIFSPTHLFFSLSFWRNFWEFRRLSFTWAGERTEAIEATGGPSQDSTMAGNEQPVLYPTGERKKRKKNPDIATTPKKEKQQQ